MTFKLNDKQKLKLRGLAEIIVECLPEETAIEGNALASGDADEDARAEQSIRDKLEAGNEWAWCCISVTLRYGNYQGIDHLGCCSYSGIREFKESDGYFPDMVANAFDQLVANIEESLSDLAPILAVSNA